MVEGVAVGVATTLVVGLLAWVGGVFKAGKNVRQLRTEIERAHKDYELWAERRDRELNDELQTIDEDHAKRSVFESGLRHTARRKAREEATLDNKAQLTKRSRAIDDAVAKLRKVDAMWWGWTTPANGWLARLRGAWAGLTQTPQQVEALLDEVLKRQENDGL